MGANLKTLSNNKVSFLSVLAVFVLFGLVFVSADIILTVVSPSNSQMNVSTTNRINLTVNNTFSDKEILIVGITIPGGMTFVADSNKTEGDAGGFFAFSNTSTLIQWANTSSGAGGAIINPNNSAQFLFNVTVDAGIANGTVKTFNVSIMLVNTTVINSHQFNITIVDFDSDSTAPNVSAINNPASNANISGVVVLNTTVVDETEMGNVQFNVSNSTGQQSLLTALLLTGTNDWNVSLNTSTLADGLYNITVVANDSSNNINNTKYVSVTIDNTNPSTTASCSPTSIQTGATFPCTCSASDATSGVQTSSGSSTSSDGTSTPSTTGTFTYTCSATDYTGNSASSTATYTVNQPPGGSTGTTSSATKTSTISNAKTGIPTELTISLDSIETIVITPSTDLASISIIAKDLGSNKPSSIPEAPIETVHKYLELTSAQSSNFQKAEITFKVENSALTDKTAALNRYANGVWNKLETKKVSSDGTHTTFMAETPGFSVFAITLEEVVSQTPEQPTEPEQPAEPEQPSEPTTQPEPMNLLLIVGVVVVIVVLVAVSLKMKSSGKKSGKK